MPMSHASAHPSSICHLLVDIAILYNADGEIGTDVVFDALRNGNGVGRLRESLVQICRHIGISVLHEDYPRSEGEEQKYLQ